MGSLLDAVVSVSPGHKSKTFPGYINIGGNAFDIRKESIRKNVWMREYSHLFELC